MLVPLRVVLVKARLVNPDPSPINLVADTVPEVWTRVTFVSPKTIVLLVVTIALAPIAVEFDTWPAEELWDALCISAL